VPPLELAYMGAYLTWRRELTAGRSTPMERRLAEAKAIEARHQAAEADAWSRRRRRRRGEACTT
jgi:hypothetical protein